MAKLTRALTPRQWRLYELLKKIYNDDSKAFMSTYQIIEAMPKDYYYLKVEMENGTPLHDCQCQQNIRADINALRNSNQIDRIVYSTSKGYKIATEEEADKLLHRWMSEAVAKLKMYWKNKKSAELNGQYRLVFNKERNIVEVFEN